MKISWRWLNSFVNLDTSSPQNLSHQMTLAGCEIEEIKKVRIFDKDDYVLDITSTPNRSDLLGMIGISKEISALLGLKQQPISNLEKQLQVLEKNMTTIDYEINKSISTILNKSCLIKNLTYTHTPEKIKNRLEASKIVISNDINDLGNYIMLKWGHPVEIVDISEFDQMNCSNITFEKQNGYKVNNAKEVVVTKYGNKIVGLTGIEVEERYKANKQSKDICIQTMTIPVEITRSNSKYANIRNESSIRHERGLNEESQKFALLDTLLLIKEMYPEALIGNIYSSKKLKLSVKEPFITLDILKVHKYLGKIKVGNVTQDIDIKRVKNILIALGCSVIRCNTLLKVTVPNRRIHDLTREIDLIEEIARIQGLNSFESILPKFKTLKTISSRHYALECLQEKLRSLGLTEVIHYSLTSKNVEETLSLENPLMTEYSCLRKNLINNLIESFSINIKKGNHNFDAFEIGRVFVKNENNPNPIEKEIVGGIFGGQPIRKSWFSPLENMDWFEAKGIIERLLYNIANTTKWENKIDTQYKKLLHPGRSGSIYLIDRYVGTFGQVHPQLMEKLGLLKPVYCFEIDLEIMMENIQQNEKHVHEFREYSLFPSITRDMAIITSAETKVDSVLNIINREKCAILKCAQLFDEYQGENIEQTQKSIAFRLVYQSNSRTLTTKEVDTIHEKIKNTIQNKIKAKFR